MDACMKLLACTVATQSDGGGEGGIIAGVTVGLLLIICIIVIGGIIVGKLFFKCNSKHQMLTPIQNCYERFVKTDIVIILLFINESIGSILKKINLDLYHW